LVFAGKVFLIGVDGHEIEISTRLVEISIMNEVTAFDIIVREKNGR